MLAIFELQNIALLLCIALDDLPEEAVVPAIRERSINRRHVYTKTDSIKHVRCERDLEACERDLGPVGVEERRDSAAVHLRAGIVPAIREKIYQSPACIYNQGEDLSITGMYIQSRLRERSINHRHVYTKQTGSNTYSSRSGGVFLCFIQSSKFKLMNFALKTRNFALKNENSKFKVHQFECKTRPF